MDLKKQLKKIMSLKSRYIIFLGILGIILIIFSTFGTKKKEKKTDETVFANTNITDIEKYSKQLENKLNNIISKIKGVGKSQVLITMENGIENIYANSEKKATNSNENFSGKMSKRDDVQKDVVIIDDHSGKKALMVTQKEPKVKGVLIVCEGADDISVVEQVIDAVSKALNITSNRISVVKYA